MQKSTVIEIPQNEYLSHKKKAKETIVILEKKLLQIQTWLKKSPDNSVYLRELKKTNLDLTITINELEHVQSVLDKKY